MSSKSEGLTLQERTDRLLGRVAGGPYTPMAPKESTSEPPKKEMEMVEEEKVPEFDVDKVEALLGILADLKDATVFPSIRESAAMQLAAIDRELWEELYPEQAEAEAKRLEELQKAEEEKAA